MTVPDSIKHIAIIMDGNGRWANAQGYARTFGHIKGARVAKRVITHAAKIGLKNLTLFAFSTENWLRPKAEVDFLMNLLDRHLRKEKQGLVDQDIRFRVIGDLGRLPSKVRRTAEETVFETSHCKGLNLTFAINYGGRQELVTAFKRLQSKIDRGDLDADQINEGDLAGCLDTQALPDPDLVIRTSGEQRLSNFMLWQVAYTEFAVIKKHWPDFTEADLENSIDELLRRERRFGGVTPGNSETLPIKSNLFHLFQ